MASGQAPASGSALPWWGAPGRTRLAFLDWLRGAGCIIMVQAQVFDSFARSKTGDDAVANFSRLIGSIAAPIFLFLVGVTLAFRMGDCDRRGLPARARWRAALSRPAYLAGVAYLFRVQRWAFSWPDGRWTDIFHVGVLNCMAAGTAVFALAALTSPAKRVKYCAMAGLGLAASVPLVSAVNWSGIPLGIRAYIVPTKASMSFFPFAAYIALGMSLGTVLWHTAMQAIDQVLRWTACIGFAIVLACLYLPTFPHWLYSNAGYGVNSPASVLIRIGIVLALLPFAFVVTSWRHGRKLGLVRTLGTNSLLVYWVHSEMVYGRWFSPMKGRLSSSQSCLAVAVVILLMFCLAALNLPGRIRRYFASYRHRQDAG